MSGWTSTSLATSTSRSARRRSSGEGVLQELQRSGKWAHIWRIVGQYSNISVFDVESADELHEILWNLPLFPYMTVEVMPLTKHGSSIR